MGCSLRLNTDKINCKMKYLFPRKQKKKQKQKKKKKKIKNEKKT